MLKLLEEKDLPRVLELGRHFLAASPYSDLRFSEEATEAYLRSCLVNPEERICILSMDGEGNAVGALLAHVSTVPFSTDKVATELAWWVEPEYRNSRRGLELKQAYEFWARKMGATKISMALIKTEHGPLLHKLYTKNGYYEAETAYVKSVEHAITRDVN